MSEVNEKALVELTEFIDRQLGGKKFALVVEHSDEIVINAGNAHPAKALELAVKSALALEGVLDGMLDKDKVAH